ncbi:MULTISPECIES: cystatin-like fold lipoprotein [Staphylococcus]|uniref:cystatin-like fold lipoprotein n=2 Tax=Staphylococcus TaxID=1279 RepID=UPI00194E0C32|nr:MULTISPECIES: cystatin-like fold lipoprotein [Staphylococcus]MCT2557151.1 DUF4467 domain-containing protein [Staphylococcus aureus]MEA1223060.1 DUF4467 domain-containing protein [Staphylococcus aureus]MEA1231812.1 DUF4467 domain-containing protein [Staphylococcus aureus]QWB97456.1 DUF4467 domain-containing protein [Staphylococcus sp. MZ8]QWB98109.1 DUF4467 domain-containing protein [Staphylococcus sp. MZ8]
MTKRFLLITLILVISTALIACGKKYDKEIEEVSKLEEKSWNTDMISNAKKFDRNTSNFYVYNDGDIILVSYQSMKSTKDLSTSMYYKNKTTGNYSENINGKPKKFMKENKPDYKEENLKE